MSRSFIAVLITLVCAVSVNAYAGTIAECGASDGYAFFPKYGLAEKSKSAGKWDKDQISKGRFTFTISDDNQFDIVVLDGMDRMFSFKDDGAFISLIGKTNTAISLIAVGNGWSEVYTVFRRPDGQAEAMWTANKFGTAITKAAAYRADCSYFVLK